MYRCRSARQSILPTVPTTMANNKEIQELTRRFAALGAPDPQSWAESQINEGFPQLGRYLFLRQAWRQVVAEDDPAWIAAEIDAAAAEPDAPFSAVGHALARLRALGASDDDLVDLARGMQANMLAAFCEVIDDGGVEEEPEAEDVRWVLCQVTGEGEVVGVLDCLHESVLETDPTGREMRPRRLPADG